MAQIATRISGGFYCLWGVQSEYLRLLGKGQGIWGDALKDTFPNLLYPKSAKRRLQHPGFHSATALSGFSSAFSAPMTTDLGDPLEEPPAAICPYGSVSGGSNFGTPFPFCVYQGPPAGPQSTRLYGTLLRASEANGQREASEGTKGKVAPTQQTL